MASFFKISDPGPPPSSFGKTRRAHRDWLRSFIFAPQDPNRHARNWLRFGKNPHAAASSFRKFSRKKTQWLRFSSAAIPPKVRSAKSLSRTSAGFVPSNHGSKPLNGFVRRKLPTRNSGWLRSCIFACTEPVSPHLPPPALPPPSSAILGFNPCWLPFHDYFQARPMHLFELTRKLIDIESVTPNEQEIGNYLWDHLSELATRFEGHAERLAVEPHRDNIFVQFGDPVVVLSTHMDTVPPYIASREDEIHIWGRGACDTKGIIAAMITAAAQLLESGKRNFGLLFVVGEERNSAGALAAAQNPRGSKFLINGEPTENKLALAAKGALRYEIVAQGRMAHSAYPELGESAIEKLLEALNRIRQLKLPVDTVLGPSTLNIGRIEGGRAPNIIPDQARAEIFVRVVSDPAELRRQIQKAAAPHAKAEEVLFIPAVQLGSLDGFPTTVVAFTTDIPAFNGAWGQPFLIGPGSIHVAHTSEERIPKTELIEAVEIYQQLVERLSA